MKEPVIICVDDEEIVLKSLKRELNNAFGDKYLIETAYGGEDALTLFEELLEEGYEIPLVLSDHIMPDIKGDELLKRIHAISPNTLKVMLTGQADMQAVTNAVNDAELYRYIAKPWEPTDLELTIKEAIRRYFQDKAIANQIKLLRNMNTDLEAKVEKRTAQLEVQKIELEQLNTSKDKLFSIIAHDLRTPFTGLLGITDFIVKNTERFSQDEIKEHVVSMREATETVYILLENLLTWAQLQQGMIEHHPQNLVLQEIAERNISFFASKAQQKQISLSNQIPQGTIVHGDRKMIDTVIRNVLSNALKFTHSGGSIDISVSQNERYADLTISDTGTGIPQEAIPLLFRIDVKYSRPGTAGEEGTGLGLILSKSLVEKNNGTMRIESTVKQGTVCSVRLPLAKNTTSL